MPAVFLYCFARFFPGLFKEYKIVLNNFKSERCSKTVLLSSLIRIFISGVKSKVNKSER